MLNHYELSKRLSQIYQRNMGSETAIPELQIRTSGDNKTSIPCLGLGTAAPTLSASEAGKQAVLEAIRLGYRHFDTAAIYGTEQDLGEAVAEALSLGLIKSRDELFITSKLWISDAHSDHVKPALQNTLKRLGVEYLDLFLIHWPIGLNKPGRYEIFFDPKLLVKVDFKSVWEAMEECQSVGLTKSIGVSNLSSKKLDSLLGTAKTVPAVNQVEMSPLWQQRELRAYCSEKGIHVTAYSPLGAKGTLWGTNRVMDSPALNQIALSKGKSVAQICLRWVYEQGVSLLVKSHDMKRIKENLDIFDWKLTPEELQIISELPQKKACLARAVNFIHEGGPFKSEEEFWDEAI